MPQTTFLSAWEGKVNLNFGIVGSYTFLIRRLPWTAKVSPVQRIMFFLFPYVYKKSLSGRNFVVK